MILALSLFAITIALTLLRPRGWPAPLWPALAGVGLIVSGLMGLERVLETLIDGASALSFLFALLVYGALLERSGFFEWSALHGARLANGSLNRLFLNFYLLAALITFTLSLDTTAVLLTPILLALTHQLRISAAPFLVMTIFISNAGSLLLPVSNLTNILFAARFELGPAVFLKWMLLPQLAVLLLLYALLRFIFRDELRASFSAAALPEPARAIKESAYFKLCLLSFPLIAAGYLIAPSFGLTPSAPLFAASALLGLAALRLRILHRDFILALPWGLFPLVFGLFLLVRFIGDSGLYAESLDALLQLGDSSHELFTLASLIGLATNLGNNLPIALFIHDLFAQGLVAELAGSGALLFASLIGANIGPLLTPFGSLATLLILSIAAKGGERLSLRRYLGLAALITPPLFIAAMAALSLSEWLFRI